MRIVALVVLVMGLAGLGFAGDAKSYMEIYEKQLNVIIQQHATDTGEVDRAYQKSLDTFLAQAKKEGDLDKTETMLAEVKRFAETHVMPEQPAEQPDIRAIQATYRKRMTALEFDQAKQITDLVAQYDAAMERLEKSLVASEKLQDAQMVRTERDKAKLGKLYLEASSVISNSLAAAAAAKPAMKEAVPAAPTAGLVPPAGAVALHSAARKRELPAATDLVTPELKRIARPKEATEPELRRYIRAVLTYSPYQDMPMQRDDIGVREQRNMLVDLGSGNLDLILSEGKRFPEGSKSFLMAGVVKSLATDDDKDMIMKAFKADVELAPVIEEKGWISDAARTLEFHLKNYSTMVLNNGYGSSQLSLFRMCFKSEDAVVHKLLIALVSDPRFTMLDSLGYDSSITIPTEVYQARWNRRDKKNASVDFAIPMVGLGNREALDAVGKYLLAMRDTVDPQMVMRGRGMSRSEFLTRKAMGVVTKYTEATPGTPAEVGQWVQKHLAELTWDAAQERFVSKAKP